MYLISKGVTYINSQYTILQNIIALNEVTKTFIYIYNIKRGTRLNTNQARENNNRNTGRRDRGTHRQANKEQAVMTIIDNIENTSNNKQTQSKH